MSCLDVQVSCYRDAYDTVGTGTVSLLDFFDNEEYKQDIEEIRSLNDPNKIKELKLALPCVTVSGIFTVRRVTGLREHSKFIGIDIDAKDNAHIPKFELIYHDLCNIENVAYCGRSAYKGFFLLIPIVIPENHKGHFKALQMLFKARFNIIIDPACSDVTRLRAMSYSVPRHFKHDAVPFSRIINDCVSSPGYSGENYLKTYVRGDVRPCLEQIRDLQLDITGNAYDWFKIGCAIAGEFGEKGRGIFHMISAYYKNSKFKYSSTETDRKYSECLNSAKKYRLGTFFYYYRLAMDSQAL